MSFIVIRIAVCILALVGCGSTAPAGSSAQPQVASVSTEQAGRLERERRSELASAHRALEAEQQTAFAATCEVTAGTPPPPRCEPSCYRAEPPDPRAGKKHDRAEIVHVVCRRAETGDAGPLVFVEEMGKGTDSLRAGRGRMPASHKKGTWEAEIEAAVGAALAPEVKRGDVIRVAGNWRTVSHPVTGERLRCVPVTHHVASMRRALDACGGRGALACEAMGNAAVHGLNVVHYRLAEARQLQAAGQLAECQRASLEAIAVARGLPRWRQYVSLNVAAWKAYPRYRTRFDGILDEDTLFTTAIALGAEAQQVHANCGGPTTPKTTAAQEQSFHTCW